MKQMSIQDIAHEAGVSVSTVSRVLNKSKPVSDTLRLRVEEVIEKYNYRPNEIARSLSIQETRLLAVITPHVSGNFHSELISQIEETASEHHYTVIIANIRGNYEEEVERILLLQDRRVDGLILQHENTVEEMEKLKEVIRVPLVMATVRVEGDPFPTVTVDDVQAAQDAVSHLIELGHTKIAGVFSHSYSSGELRKRGYLRALELAGIEPNPAWFFYGEVTAEASRRIMKEMLALQEQPTAIFFVGDEMAIGAMMYLKQEGYDIPGDYAICGFDDIELGQYVTPRLTTMRQPIDQIGRAATEELIRLIDEGTMEGPLILLPHCLVEGESAQAKPKKREVAL